MDNKAQWAQATRKTQTDEQQAQLFYEAYRLQLVREQDLKQQLKNNENIDVERNRKIMVMELELGEARKKIAKMKKDPVENVVQGGKKRKLDQLTNYDFYNDLRSFESGQ